MVTRTQSAFGSVLRQWRERRRMSLTAAGFAAMYRETELGAPAMSQVRRALDFMLKQQEPYPALVLDRHWNVLQVNDGSARIQQIFLDPVKVAKIGPPNAMRLTYPDVPRHMRTVDLDASPAPFLSIEFRRDDLSLRYFTTLTSLGTPHDVTLQGLRVECFYPADEHTEAATRRLAGAAA